MKPELQRVVCTAYDEAVSLHSDEVTDLHLLLGMLKEESCVALLASQGVNVKALEVSVRQAIPLGIGEPKEPEFSQVAKIALENAYAEARRFHESRVGVKHLLLGVLRNTASSASRLLAVHGLTYMDLVEPPRPEVPEPRPPRSSYQDICDHLIRVAGTEESSLKGKTSELDRLFLALLRTASGLTSDYLERKGVSYEEARRFFSQGSSSLEPTPKVERAERRHEGGTWTDWDTLTPPAKDILYQAIQETIYTQAESIGLEHLLLALFKTPQGPIAGLVEKSHLDVSKLCGELLSLIEPQESAQHSIAFSPSLMSALRVAGDLAGSELIAPEHLLLGALETAENPLKGLLLRFGIDYDSVKAIFKILP